MSDNKDYTTSELEELLTEEKKMKRKEITAAVIIGFLVGVMIYGVAKSGFDFTYIVIPLILIGGIARHSQKLKQELKAIRAAINAKK